jgi:glycosyltransferase involved in cell wall biosynthesis
MTRPGVCSKNSVLFLTPEAPALDAGGGGLRSASLLVYLQARYAVEVVSFNLPAHSGAAPARIWRNAMRLVRGVPPLLDRYSGCEAQLDPFVDSRNYALAVIEHFWCAPYAARLRPHATRLLLDLHNIESELAASKARAASWPLSAAFQRFAGCYRRLERRWLPSFDLVLVASEDDRRRVDHPNVHVYPNALPEIPRPASAEADCIIFSGNLKYDPNVDAVRWFRSKVWPAVRARFPGVEWRLVGRNQEAVEPLVSGDPRIRVIGPIENAVAALSEAKVCVVPLISGSGTRFKILEAWAASRAVVSTSIGAEGLGARPGEHLLIADEPAVFADAIARLLESPDLRQSLGEAGRRLYLDRYTWPAAWRRLEEAGV